MASEKVRYINFNPTEFNDGIAGEELGVDGVGTYWISCSIIYAKGDAWVDEEWLGKKIKALSGGHMKTIKSCLDRLVNKGKMVRKGSEITAKRVQKELESAAKRIHNSRENGAKGGRPSNKNKDLAKGVGLKLQNLPIYNTKKQEQETNIQEGEFLNPENVNLNRWANGKLKIKAGTVAKIHETKGSWSSQYLEDQFNDLNINNCVQNPDAAFIAFVKKHIETNGKNP